MPSEGETLELEVPVGGETHLMQYRTEILRWGPDALPDEPVDQLRAFLREYDSDWSLVQIRSPGQGGVPVTFRRREASRDGARIA